MYKILRIICSIIAALIVAVCVFIFVYLGWAWGLLCVFVAAAFFGLTLLFKHLQEKRENKEKNDEISALFAEDEKTAKPETDGKETANAEVSSVTDGKTDKTE